MAKLIDGSIDFSKIQSARFKTQKGTDCILIPINQDGIGVGKDGKLFFNITIHCNDEKNQYDQDTSISLKQTKEQKDAKVARVYVGNGKTFWTSEGRTTTPLPQTNEPINNEPIDDLPF